MWHADLIKEKSSASHLEKQQKKAFTYYGQDRKHLCYFCQLSSKHASFKLLGNTHFELLRT